MARLGRVTDPEALDASDGTRASLRIEVPQQWLRDGAELEVSAPKMLTCDRCDGGGCDGCGRSGALRGPDETDARRLSIQLPPGHEDGLQLRLVDPFQDSEIEQIIVTIQPAEVASKGVVRLEPAAALAPWKRRDLRGIAAVGLGIVALVIAWLLGT
jgi:hypothetical protein